MENKNKNMIEQLRAILENVNNLESVEGGEGLKIILLTSVQDIMRELDVFGSDSENFCVDVAKMALQLEILQTFLTCLLERENEEDVLNVLDELAKMGIYDSNFEETHISYGKVLRNAKHFLRKYILNFLSGAISGDNRDVRNFSKEYCVEKFGIICEKENYDHMTQREILTNFRIGLLLEIISMQDGFEEIIVSENCSFAKKNQNLREKNSELKRNLEAACENSSAKDDAIQFLQDSNDSLEKKNQDLRRKLEELEESKNLANEDDDLTQILLLSANEENERLQEENKELRGEIDTLQREISWENDGKGKEKHVQKPRSDKCEDCVEKDEMNNSLLAKLEECQNRFISSAMALEKIEGDLDEKNSLIKGYEERIPELLEKLQEKDTQIQKLTSDKKCTRRLPETPASAPSVPKHNGVLKNAEERELNQLPQKRDTLLSQIGGFDPTNLKRVPEDDENQREKSSSSSDSSSGGDSLNDQLVSVFSQMRPAFEPDNENGDNGDVEDDSEWDDDY